MHICLQKRKEKKRKQILYLSLRNEEEGGVMELDGWHGSSGSTSITATIRGGDQKRKREAIKGERVCSKTQ